MIFGMGMIESGVTFSFTQLILDDDIVNDTKKIIRKDLDMDKLDDLAWQNNQAGKGFPSRFCSPLRARSLLALGMDPMVLSSKRDIVQDAQQKVQTILDRHKPESLPATVVHRIREIILDTEERKCRE